MKLFEKPSDQRYWLSLLVITLALHGGMALAVEPAVSEPAGETTVEPMGLIGEWCLEKKRKITRYTIKEGKLHIRSGRSGQQHQADLTCDDAYTVCKAKTIRGWGTPVTETMRLNGETMDLTRVWGGSWKDKTYNFTYTRCPKW